MADKLWKSFERWVGKEIFNGSSRNMGSGAVNKTDDGEDRTGDVIHPTYQIECKVYKKIAVFRWWDKLKLESIKSNKIPVLVMREKGDIEDTLVTINYKFFIELKNLWEKQKEGKIL
jgi:hypothetical protein